MATAVPIIVASIVLAIIRKKVRSRNVRLISGFFIKIVTLAIIGITVTTTIQNITISPTPKLDMVEGSNPFEEPNIVDGSHLVLRLKDSHRFFCARSFVHRI